MDEFKETSPNKVENNADQKTHSRRRFLRDAAALTLTPVALYLATPALALGGVNDRRLQHRRLLQEVDLESWQEVRRMFSFSEGNVPMNAANLCPSFKQIADRVFFLTQKLNEDVSFNNRESFKILLELARTKIANSLNVSADDVALVRNTSEANCVINNGLNFNRGENVVVWEENHATNNGDDNGVWTIRKKRWNQIDSSSRLTIRTVETKNFGKPITIDQIVGEFLKQVDENTRLVTFTEISNMSGIKLPAKEICQAVHNEYPNCKVHVDGAQSWGAQHLDLSDMGCDSFAASSHKWFCGPKETGILYVKPDFAQQIAPLVWSYNGHIVVPDVLPDNAGRFETLGQRDDAAISAMGGAVDIHSGIGFQNIEDRVIALATQLKTGLSNISGVTLVTPMAPLLSHGVVVISLPETIDPQSLVDILYKQHGIAGSTTGGLRLCPHIYNTDEHIQRAVDGVAAALETTPNS